MSTSTAWGAGALSPESEARFARGVEYCGRFFMGESEAHKALYKLTALLDADGLPYAIIGAFALLEYGHRRVTVDVDLVMRDQICRSSSGATSTRATPSASRAPVSSSTPSSA